MKKLAIVGTTGLPAKYGGFETLTHFLTRHLNQKFDITVYCSSKYFASRGQRRTICNNSRLLYLPFNANGYQSIIYDIVSILHALLFADAILVLGVSGAIILPFVKLLSTKPIIVNIDGQEWKRGKWNFPAKQFLRFSERIAVKYADTVIADNKVISDYVRKTYKRDTILIEYGGDHTTSRPWTADDLVKYPFLVNPYAFTVCRIEPENNVHLILEAFAATPHKTLVVVGLWDHGRFGMNLKKKYEAFANIILLDPVYEIEELDMLRSNASLYIHGHSAGGTNPSLVEAMCLGLPVFAFDVEYNRVTTRNKAMYFSGATDLSGLLDTVSDEDLAGSGKALMEYAREKYTWTRIVSEYEKEVRNLTDVAVDLLSGELKIRKEEIIHIYVDDTKEVNALK